MVWRAGAAKPSWGSTACWLLWSPGQFCLVICMWFICISNSTSYSKEESVECCSPTFLSYSPRWRWSLQNCISSELPSHLFSRSLDSFLSFLPSLFASFLLSFYFSFCLFLSIVPSLPFCTFLKSLCCFVSLFCFFDLFSSPSLDLSHSFSLFLSRCYLFSLWKSLHSCGGWGK